MPFDLSDTQFTGPALPEPFVKFELENELTKLKLLPKTTGSEGKQLKDDWEAYRRHLSQLAVRGGPCASVTRLSNRFVSGWATPTRSNRPRTWKPARAAKTVDTC